MPAGGSKSSRIVALPSPSVLACSVDQLPMTQKYFYDISLTYLLFFNNFTVLAPSLDYFIPLLTWCLGQGNLDFSYSLIQQLQHTCYAPTLSSTFAKKYKGD